MASNGLTAVVVLLNVAVIVCVILFLILTDGPVSILMYLLAVYFIIVAVAMIIGEVKSSSWLGGTLAHGLFYAGWGLLMFFYPGAFFICHWSCLMFNILGLLLMAVAFVYLISVFNDYSGGKGPRTPPRKPLE